MLTQSMYVAQKELIKSMYFPDQTCRSKMNQDICPCLVAVAADGPRAEALLNADRSSHAAAQAKLAQRGASSAKVGHTVATVVPFLRHNGSR